ncbi:MAG TPA: Re/Si-specific NAD(P)(+) transhydrogenase subunit alpha [Thermodesulfobacteriota bacterium]|nr:Re/Si-specific NAD(P)(+) transhydrogenase subunit alpha [Thermodesulfobacteriota bacterium]
MKIGVPREIVPGERRVALVPETVGRLVKSGATVLVERGAGERAFFADRDYEAAGATLVDGPQALYAGADLVVKVQRPVRNEAVGRHEVELMREGTVLVAFLQPLANPELVRMLAARRITSLSMDAIPRITRAQPMDALSSQATVAGYLAALIAASRLPKFFPMLTTAAGTIQPAKVLVVGAGVAGLQAIATARRLGAVVSAYDTRPAVKEQVQSLGARFVEIDLGTADTEGAGGYAKALADEVLRRQQALLAKTVADSDAVITTALVPGARAPLVVPDSVVRQMRPGSVIVDLAAEQGGNVEGTEPDREVVRHGVLVCGPVNLPSRMPLHASQMYSRNLHALLAGLIGKDGSLALDFGDEIVKESCITHAGRVVHGPTAAVVG